ncbi:MAG: PAS domain-containing protein, partial [Deltaproteobacteria bacterium]|nr:PAS domain-containing protein [Deltaproteobacteria bacterium]
LERGEFYVWELDITRKDGSARTIACSFLRRPSPFWGEKSWAVGLDITEQKRAEEALRIKDWALKSSHNGIALADLDGRLTYVNDAFLKMWGYEDGGKMLGKSAIGFWQETDRARDIIIDLFDKGNWEGEMAAVKSDGSEFDVHLSASMVLDKDGNPCCMMASFIDITERKRAERAVKENEQKMKALLNATNNPEVLLAPGGIILTLNETAATVFGGRPDEFIGKNIGNFVPPEQYEYMRVQSSNVRAMEKPLHLETENNNRIYDTCIYPVFDAEDNATAVAICSIDIRKCGPS